MDVASISSCHSILLSFVDDSKDSKKKIHLRAEVEFKFISTKWKNGLWKKVIKGKSKNLNLGKNIQF